MKEKTYRNIASAAGSSPSMRMAIVLSNRIITTTVYLLYPVLLGLLLHKRGQIPLSEGFTPALLIPGISFIILSIVRDRINAPRPYEVFDLKPVIDKKTAGHSFPSRHVFSIFVISATMFYFYPVAGSITFLLGIALAVNRVLGGVHFVRDVVVGAVCGMLCGVVGFYVILPLLVN